MTTQSIIDQAKKEKRLILTDEESKTLLTDANIRTTKIAAASTREEAINKADEIGYPVVVKIDSTDITHKSDVGGVSVNLKDAGEVGDAFDTVINSAKENAPGASIQGVTVQEMADPGVEVIIGLSKDPQFGPVLMFGLGGIAVEILKDVAFRIVPLEKRDAKQLIREIKD